MSFLEAEEDVACAELIAALATGPGVDPGSYVERAERSSAASRLAEGVGKGCTGVSAEDVPMCLDVDRFSFSMVARPVDGLLVLRRGRVKAR